MLCRHVPGTCQRVQANASTSLSDIPRLCEGSR